MTGTTGSNSEAGSKPTDSKQEVNIFKYTKNDLESSQSQNLQKKRKLRNLLVMVWDFLLTKIP